MIPNSTKVQRSHPTVSSHRSKVPDTNLSDAKRRVPETTDRPLAGRSKSDRSIELGRRSIPLISQRQRSVSSRLGAAPTASLETTTFPTKSRSVSAPSSPDIFDLWNTWSHRESSHSATCTTASASGSSSSSSSSPSSSPASKKQVFADQFQVRQYLAARGEEIRAGRSRRSRPVTNETKQHSVRASKEPVKTNSKVTFSSSAKKIDGGSRVRRRRSSNSGSSSKSKGDRRRHARHHKCEIEGLSIMQSLSISNQDHSSGIDNTNADTASDSMRTIVSMSSYDSPISPPSLAPLPPSPPLSKTCAQMAAHSECGPTSTGSSGSLEKIWSPPCA